MGVPTVFLLTWRVAAFGGVLSDPTFSEPEDLSVAKVGLKVQECLEMNWCTARLICV